MERPETRYAKTNDGLSIAYQVFGSGPFDLVYTPGWISNLVYTPGWISNVDAAWELPGYGAFLGALSGISRVIVFDRRGSGLFTDIVGSTERACHSVMLRGRTSLNDHHVVRTMRARYQGTEIDTAGDGFFATFEGREPSNVHRRWWERSRP